MMMGMNFGVFIIIAAFVEFTLSFYLATGRGLLRFGALALLGVFISAMPEFGPPDVVGHFPLVAILGVPFMAGDSALQRFWRLPDRGVLVNAAASCLLYLITLLSLRQLSGCIFAARFPNRNAAAIRVQVQVWTVPH